MHDCDVIVRIDASICFVVVLMMTMIMIEPAYNLEVTTFINFANVTFSYAATMLKNTKPSLD
jgi:hypothetical protein